MPRDRLDVLRPIFTPDPVNWQHPLNRLRVAWWLALPPADGGGSFYNLAGPGSHGVLTAGGAAASPSWQGSTRPGGFAHLNYAGSNYVTGPYLPALVGKDGPGGELSVAVWVKYTDASVNQSFICSRPTNGCWLLFLQSGSLTWRATGQGDLAAAAPTAGTWHHIVGTGKSYISGVQYADTHLYVDGVEVANGGPTDLSSGSSLWQWVAGTANIDLGGLVDLGIYPLSGSMDDVSVWNRALSAREVWQLYQEALHGYPETLRRLRSLVSWLLGAPAGPPSYTPAVGGGLVVGGKAAPAAAYAVTTQGGLLGGAGAVPAAAFHPTTRGGLAAGGTAAPATAYVLTTQGGLLGGGHTGPAGAYVVTAQGGLLGGGHAAPQNQFSATPRGGLAGGGTTSVVTAWHPGSQGGLAGGGHVVPAAAYPLAAGGGLLGGGHGVVVSGNLVTAGGGLAGGGRVLVSGPVYAPGTAGGIMVGGSAPPAYGLRLTVGGGLLGGGHVPALASYVLTVGGGLAGGGHILFSSRILVPGPYLARGFLHADQPGIITPGTRPRTTRWRRRYGR